MRAASSLPNLTPALMIILLAIGCGRTELDGGGTIALGLGGAGGAGGAGAAGAGGAATGMGGGRGGAGGAGGAASGVDAGAGAGGRGVGVGQTPIPCGTATCTPGAQVCCFDRANGRATETCISAQAVCRSGESVACLDASGCGAGQICCATVLGASTTCTTAETCERAPGLILCTADADCPMLAPNCCRPGPGNGGNAGICAAQTCPER
jgi:hypothetical protein